MQSFARGIYYAFFHHLAKVPGPKFYAASNVPFVWYSIRGEWPQVLKKLHDKYGPVVRFGPEDVSLTTADAWRQVYGHKRAGEPTFEKDDRFRLDTKENHIIVANADDHRRMRRLLSHAFSEKALRSQEDIMKQYVDLFIQKLSDLAAKGTVVDLVSWYNFTTFDLIGDLAFGQPFHCLESGGYHPWVSMVFDFVHILTYSMAFQRIPSLKLLAPFLVPVKLIKGAKEHRLLSEKTALQRIENGNTVREDFISYILRHNDEKGMTTSEIVDNAGILIIAGSETTATLLSGTTFQLLKHRHVYDKLVQEIRSTFTTEDEITISRVNELEYMLAVINEGFRMYPPVPVGLARLVPKEGQFVEGFWMPEKTSVSVAQWAAYQSERNWCQPQEFIPERWLGDPRFAHDARDVLNPFSYGPRNCIGKNLAYAEMRLILVRLLWNFDLELQAESKDWQQQKVYVLWEKKPLSVKLTPVIRD
ncbi:cytochrome P450 [Thozetella sp. PMI_491]|nr:cytochrome P450 [Thozetella sp. PMI_491]